MYCPPAVLRSLDEVFWVVSLKGVDDRHKGSALDVPTPKSLEETFAWTPVTKIYFTKESLMKQHIMKAKRNARKLTNYIKSKCTEGGR